MKHTLKMKLLLVTCIVASAFAAPSERIRRDILPGDPRYDAKHHQQYAHHEHYNTEVEIAKALGGYAGTFSGPALNFDFSGLETGDSFGDTEFLKYNIDANKAAVNSDLAIDVSGSKDFERLTSVSDESSASPKVEPATVDKYNDIAGSDEADQPTSDSADPVSRIKINDADKESSENADKTKLESKSASEETSSDASKTTETKPATVDGKTSTKAISNVASSATDSLTTPLFDSTFDSSFSSFDQIGYNPSFHSLNGYFPEFSTYSLSDEFYKNIGGLPLNIDTYSGFGKETKGSTIGFNSPVNFSPVNPLDFTKNIPYIPPSTFSSFQPDIKITRGSYTGGSQLTDSNGGYVY